jgi:hypothetical protein
MPAATEADNDARVSHPDDPPANRSPGVTNPGAVAVNTPADGGPACSPSVACVGADEGKGGSAPTCGSPLGGNGLGGTAYLPFARIEIPLPFSSAKAVMRLPSNHISDDMKRINSHHGMDVPIRTTRPGVP